jgi:hypothetical protein
MTIHLYSHKSGKWTIRKAKREGKDTIIVPVIMARADTVMNGALIPADQFHPQSWNGVPVTVQHPDSDFGSANDPDTLSEWAVGNIFNASFVDGVLKGEAWIDVQKANKVAKGLVDALSSGEQMDVSTGYFATDVASRGVLNGKEYTVEHHDLKPDHLALLPGVEGACNWRDGCGVRANRSGQMSTKKTLADALALIANALGVGDKAGDRKTAVAALIANAKSPYTDADAKALEAMSAEAFEATVNAFPPEDDKEDPKEDDKAMGNAEGDEPDGDEPPAKQKKNELKKDKKVMKQNCGCGANAHTMSAEDREALAYGQSQLKAHRAGLIEKVVAHSEMKKEVVEKFSTADLEVIANGLKVVDAPVYGGRPALTVVKGNEETKKLVPTGVLGAIANAKKKKETA